jgi:hypothetical protein
VSFAATVSSGANRPPAYPINTPIRPNFRSDQFNQPHCPGAPLAQNVSRSERESVACLERKTQIRGPLLSSKQQVTVFTLLPPPLPQFPSTSRAMHGFIVRGGSLSRIAPPLLPSLQPDHHRRSSPTSSGIQQQPRPEYPTVPVGPMDEHHTRGRRVGEGQSPTALSIAQQQQQQTTGYPTQQHQSQSQTGRGPGPSNTPISQPSQISYGYSPTSANPTYSQRAHPVHMPTRNPLMYAPPIPTVPSQWTSTGSTQGQEQYYYAGAAAYTSPAHETGAYQVHTPTASSSSRPGSTAHPTPPMVPEPILSGATVPLITKPFSLPAASKGVAAGPSAPVSAVSSRVPHRGGRGGTHAHPAHPPTRNPPMATALIPPAPSQWTNGGSAQDQEQYYYHSAHAAYPQIEQMQPYQPQPYTSPIPVGVADGLSEHVPPYLAQATLTAPGESSYSRAAAGGSNASIGGTRTMGEPGPSRSDRTNRRQVSKPYKRPTPGAHKTRPVTYEGNLVRLQQRCRRQGADEGAIGLLGKVFANEVSLEALTRLLTDAEVETTEFGVETGSVYIALLETTDEGEGLEPRYVCRLCHSEQTWKHSRDALRHLRRDHFGLADICDQWYVFGRLLVLVSINVLFGDIAVKGFTLKGR